MNNMNEVGGRRCKGVIIDVDEKTGKSIYEYRDINTGEKLDYKEKDGYVYKPFDRGLTVRTLSPNVVNVSWVQPARAQAAYEIELAKIKNETNAKLALNEKIIVVHNSVQSLTGEKGLVRDSGNTEKELSVYDELIYSVASVVAKIERKEINDLVLEDVGKSLAVIMSILSAKFPEYCSRILGELMKHKDENFRAYIKMLKGMIASCG